MGKGGQNNPLYVIVFLWRLILSPKRVPSTIQEYRLLPLAGRCLAVSEELWRVLGWSLESHTRAMCTATIQALMVLFYAMAFDSK